MKEELIKSNPIVTLSISFAVSIIEYCELLTEKRKFILANQLCKSGTSIGANVREAQNPESRADFIHKMKVAAKEAEETQYWLLLCEQTPGLPELNHLKKNLESLHKLIGKIIGSAKQGI